MFCPNCGTAYDNVRFCPGCGMEVASPAKRITQETTLGDGIRVQQTTTVASSLTENLSTEDSVPDENISTENSDKGWKRCLEGFLFFVLAVGLFWFFILPSRGDIEEKTRKSFLEMCDEKGWNVTDTNIKEFTLITESRLHIWKYKGFVLLEAETGENVWIPFSVTVDFSRLPNGHLNFQEYQITCTLEAQGECLFNTHFSKGK